MKLRFKVTKTIWNWGTVSAYIDSPIVGRRLAYSKLVEDGESVFEAMKQMCELEATRQRNARGLST